MSIPDATAISQTFTANYQLIQRNIRDVNQAGSLIQPPFPGNCLNWVLGHLISGRNEALGFLATDLVWGDEEVARYKTGSAAIIQADQALPLEQLLVDLDRSQELLTAALTQVNQEALDKVVETRFGERPMGQHLSGLGWHETYHTGQLELLRELALAHQ